MIDDENKQRTQFLPTERQFFNYGNTNTVARYNSFFSGPAAGGNIVPGNKLVLNNDSSKILFGATFNAGFDNTFDWGVAVKTGASSAEFLAISRNSSHTFLNDSIGPADTSTSSLPINIDMAGTPGDVFYHSF